MKFVFLFAVILFIDVEGINSLGPSICCSTPPRCYTSDPPFQLMPLPQCPEDQGVVMKLYTKQNPTVGQDLTNTSIPSVYDGSLTTIYLVHGWTQNENFSWLNDARDGLFTQGDYNIVIFGWAIGASYVFYPQAAANTRTAGSWLALLSNYTIQHGGSSRSRQYCIGASLGAHVCGLAGIDGQFGRITGLDPAGPLFEESDESAGLNSYCATLVDVIHTNGGEAGTIRTLGHKDFYVNGGHIQPGCAKEAIDPLLDYLPDIFDNPETTIETAQNVSLLCFHIRAIKVFNESIRTPCFSVRLSCANEYIIPDDCCPPHVIKDTPNTKPPIIGTMGFKADTYPTNGSFLLITNGAPPYCLN